MFSLGGLAETGGAPGNKLPSNVQQNVLSFLGVEGAGAQQQRQGGAETLPPSSSKPTPGPEPSPPPTTDAIQDAVTAAHQKAEWKPKRVTTNQPGSVTIRPDARKPHQGPVMVFRPRGELSVFWSLPVSYVETRSHAVPYNSGPEAATTAKNLKTLNLGLFRRGVGTCQNAIITKQVTGFNVALDSKGPSPCYRGMVPFYAPRSPGTFVFRLFFEGAEEGRYQLGTSQTMYVEVQGRDLEPNLRFTLSQFKAKKTSLAALHQIGQVLQGLRAPLGGGDGSGRAAWGCFCESRKVLQGVEREVTEKEAEVEEIEKLLAADADNAGLETERKLKRAGLESLYRKRRDVEVALSQVMTHAVRNPAARQIFREDQWEGIRKEYETWCILSEKFAPNGVRLEDYQKDLFGFTPRMVLGKGGSAIASLSAQIRDNQAKTAPGPRFTEERAKVRARLQSIVSACMSLPAGTDLHIFGSSANGFGSPNSDLDMCLAVPGGREGLEDGVASMGALAEDLERAGMEEVSARLTARIPIIMFKDNMTGLDCDISLHNPLAVKNTQLLMSYSTVDPRVRQLAYAVKRWSKARDLNNPSSGTLSSYGWMIMLLHFLQGLGNQPVLPHLQKITPLWKGEPEKIYEGIPPSENMKHPTAPDVTVNTWFYRVLQPHGKDKTRAKYLSAFAARNTMEVGYLLAGFFRYYAYQFDFRRFVVSLYPGGRLLEKDMMGELHCWPVHVGLGIQDPFENFYNVGHVVKTAQFYRIRKECARAFSLIADAGGER